MPAREPAGRRREVKNKQRGPEAVMIEILGISFGAAGLLTLFLLGPAPFRRLVRVEAFAVVRRRAGRNDWTTPDRR
jgi:hypothetical protein